VSSLSNNVTFHCPVCLRERGELICYASRQKHCVICQCETLEPLELATHVGALPQAEQIVGDPAVSFWLKNALLAALTRDPVDAANDADVLAQILDQRSRKILQAPEGVEFNQQRSN
jgi:hypothetical protein